MHILLVNDDGIHAKGIRTLCAMAADAGYRVSVCAPDQERSGASHSFTLGGPLYAKKTDVPGAEVAYSINGTPADCARMGLYLIHDVDMVISGVNDGSNLGNACLYSGTVGAAMEASMAGVPALAASQHPWGYGDFTASAKITLKVLDWMKSRPLPKGCIYSLNVPARPYEEILGIRAAELAPSYYDVPTYRPVETEMGVGYMYVYGEDTEDINRNGCDIPLVLEGYATLTKLTPSLQMDNPCPDVSELSL